MRREKKDINKRYGRKKGEDAIQAGREGGGGEEGRKLCRTCQHPNVRIETRKKWQKGGLT